MRECSIRFKVVSIAGLLLTLGQASSAQASARLKQIVSGSNSQVELIFDAPVKKNQLKTEYFNDIIQVSISEAAVYPPKILSTRGEGIIKVFAYQYSPKLIRCRLTVRGKAEDYKDRLQAQVQAGGKVIALRLEAAKPASEESESSAASSPAYQEIKSAEGDRAPAVANDEKKLLEKVLSRSEDKQSEAEAPAERKPSAASGSNPLGAAQILSVLAKLGLVLALCLGFIFALNRLKSSDRALPKFMKNMLKAGKMGFKPREKMIEMMATYHLGPKKSIAVVRVADRTLVLGISSETISLITQIAADEGFDPALEEDAPAGKAKAASGASSSDEPTMGFPEKFSDQFDRVKLQENLREKIRSKLEGLKPL